MNRQLKLERSGEIKGDNVLIHTIVIEEIDHKTMVTSFQQQNVEIQSIQNQIETEKNKLDDLQQYKETPEILLMKKNLVTANKLIEKDECIKQLKKLEVDLVDKKNALEKLRPVYNEALTKIKSKE